MPKGNRTIVYLVSTANTGYSYTTTKNRRLQPLVFEEKNKL